MKSVCALLNSGGGCFFILDNMNEGKIKGHSSNHSEAIDWETNVSRKIEEIIHKKIFPSHQKKDWNS